MQEDKNFNTVEEDTIDIIAILKEFWASRKTILKITVIFTFLGLFVVVFSKNEYTASTTFVPLVDGSSKVGGLGGLASLAGINLGGGINNEEISPELYPQIINSIPFQLELLNTPLTIEGQEKQITYRDFYKNVYSSGLLSNIKKYTLGLPRVLISLLKSDLKEVEKTKNSQENQIITISNEENGLINQLEGQVSLNVNSKEGFITISVTLPEALASAQLALKAQQLLQDYALRFKTQKSNDQLNYIKERFTEKKSEYNKIKIALARFQDRNNGINTALGRTQLLQLRADYDLAFSVYSELAKQLEAQQLQVKKDTPLFTVLKPVTLPKKRSAPKKTNILAIYFFLGFISSLGFVLGKKYWYDFKKQWALK